MRPEVAQLKSQKCETWQPIFQTITPPVMPHAMSYASQTCANERHACGMTTLRFALRMTVQLVVHMRQRSGKNQEDIMTCQGVCPLIHASGYNVMGLRG